MGSWGTAIYSDDLASDLRSDFRELVGDGLNATDATEHLMLEYESSLRDADEMPVFWIALALTQWNLGRLENRTKSKAVELIDSGLDLGRWEAPGDRKKRAAVLAKTRATILSSPPAEKKVPRTIRESNEWTIGEVVEFQLMSKSLVLLRVIGHHTDKGGRFAVCELLDWNGSSLPEAGTIDALPIRKERATRGCSQFLFQEPRNKAGRARVRRTGHFSEQSQSPGGYTVFVWPYVDSLFRKIFDLE